MATNKLSRREFLKASAVGAVSLTFAAKGINFVRAQDQVTLTLIDPWAATTFGDAHDAQIQRFMESHPNIKIERSAVNFNDFVQLLVQGAAAGELPDIALIDNPDF